MNIVSCKIDGITVEVPNGTSILDAASAAGISIPSLCHLKDINCVGACRICLVAITGRQALVPACSTKIEAGMEIETSNPEIESIRLQNLQLICSHHRQDCSRCTRFPYCELHTLCRQYGIDDRQNMFNRKEDISDSFVHLIRDQSKCIQCRRCISMCRNVQGIDAIYIAGRGMSTKITSVHGAENICVNCGQCISVCPTNALTEKDDTQKVGVALAQRKKHVVAVVSREATAQLGEYFGASISDTQSKGKTIAALRRLGFHAVFSAEPFFDHYDRALYAELVQHMQNNSLPLISTKCPSIKKYCKINYPELNKHLSSLDSPIQTAAEACAQFYAQTHNLPLADILVVTISSCTADKYECSLPAYINKIYASLTSHEVYLLFERACVSSFSARQVWSSLPEECYDECTGILSTIQCANIPQLHTKISSGLKTAKLLLDELKQGTSEYALLELMACPGGCINGAGRSRQFSHSHTFAHCSIAES